jgi:hypothetical protein
LHVRVVLTISVRGHAAPGPEKAAAQTPLSAQAKPGRPSGVAKKEKRRTAGERAGRRRHAQKAGFHRQQLVSVKGHGRLNKEANNSRWMFIMDICASWQDFPKTTDFPKTKGLDTARRADNLPTQ